MSHSAFHACSRCLKEFPTAKFEEKPDYSGFDRTKWPKRTNISHRHYAYKYRECKTAQERTAIERNHGCRYSVLLELPYYEAIRMCVVDPMHNLLLGTAQHVVSVWNQSKLLDLALIQSNVDNFMTPNHFWVFTVHSRSVAQLGLVIFFELRQGNDSTTRL